MCISPLSLTLRCAEWSYCAISLIRQLDLAKGLFEVQNIVLQELQQALGMLWSQDDTALNLWLWHSRECSNEIENELRR